MFLISHNVVLRARSWLLRSKSIKISPITPSRQKTGLKASGDFSTGGVESGAADLNLPVDERDYGGMGMTNGLK